MLAVRISAFDPKQTFPRLPPDRRIMLPLIAFPRGPLMRFGVFSVLLLVLAAAHPTSASAERRVALVIGNSAYQNVPKLANSVNDARAIATLLKNAGFDIVESRSDLGMANIRRAMRDFINIARDADIGVVYYAGHGIEVDGTNYLIPVDAVLEHDVDVDDEALSVDRVLKTLEAVKRLRLVILDACRDNPFARSMKRTIASRSIGRGLAKVEPTTSDTLIAFAAKAGSTAMDGNGKNSPFTAALLKYLATPGLDVRIAFGRVRDDVLKATSNQQEPFVYGSLGGDVVSLVPAQGPKVVAPTSAGAENIADARRDYYEFLNSGATKEAWSDFLQLHPTGPYANLARNQLAKLNDAETKVAEKEAAERAATEKKAAAEKAAAEKAAAEKAEADRVAAAKKAAAEKAAAERAAAEQERIAREAAEGERRTREESERAHGAPAAVEAPLEVQTTMLAPVASVAPRPTAPMLIEEIKRELKRVGCYEGRLDNDWSTDNAKGWRWCRMDGNHEHSPPSGVSVLRFQFRCQRIGALVPESRRLPGGLQLQLVQLQRSGLPGGSELQVLRPSRTLTPVSVSDSKEAMGHAARRGPFADLGAVTKIRVTFPVNFGFYSTQMATHCSQRVCPGLWGRPELF